MFDNALELKTYVEVTNETDEAIEVLHSGEITCREFRQGQFFYHVKPKRGKALWFSHGEIDGSDKVDMSAVEGR